MTARAIVAGNGEGRAMLRRAFAVLIMFAMVLLAGLPANAQGNNTPRPLASFMSLCV
jgi:hypothetical protein